MARNWETYSGKTALVIDDEVLMKRLIKHLLTEMGFSKVLTAEDGAEGLKVLETNADVDIVICDLEMPLIGGLEFLGMLRSSSSVHDPQVPVLVATGHSEERHLHRAVKLGINGFVVKPLSYKSLESRIYYALTHDQIAPDQLSKALAHPTVPTPIAMIRETEQAAKKAR